MAFSREEYGACDRLAQLALIEDLGNACDNSGDLTSVALIPEDAEGQAVFVSRANGVVAGLTAASLVFALLDPKVSFQELIPDGTPVQAGTQLAIVDGPMRMILLGERTALNFLQRLSGIASLTAEHVRRIADLPCKLLDTRKTTPGWRLLEKYAVRQGGGNNHRMGGPFCCCLLCPNCASRVLAVSIRARSIERAMPTSLPRPLPYWAF